MNAQQIAEQLAKKPSSEAAYRLMQACEPRRIELRARAAEIAQSMRHIPDTPARAKAVLKGPDAVRALDLDLETLDREITYLDRLEAACYEAHEAALTEEMQRAIPVSRKSLPGAMDRVRAAVAALDSALATINQHVETLGQYSRLGKDLPLSDGELAALLDLRAHVWGRRDVRVLQPPDTYQQSWSKFYEKRHGGSVIVRKPPGNIHLPDLVGAV